MVVLWWIIVGLIAGWATGKIMRGSGYGVLADILSRHYRPRQDCRRRRDPARCLKSIPESALIQRRELAANHAN